MKKRNILTLVLSLAIVYATAFLGSLFTTSAVKTEWYASIRPAITPPNWIFPIVWNVLFFLIALSLYFAWTNSKNKRQKTKVAIVFGINLILNALWSYLFFGLQNPLAGFVDILLIDISIIVTMLAVYKISKKSAWLLAPYLLWVSFASIINYLAAF